MPNDWRDIETAPKDGAKFLFIEARGRIQVGRFASQWGEPAEVWVCLTTSGGYDYPSTDPTHWMPLPAPPPDMATPEGTSHPRQINGLDRITPANRPIDRQ